MKIITDIYRSTKKEGLYLFVPAGTDLKTLPEALIASFGRAEFSMKIALSEERKLARADAQEVISALKDKGFYLQMPPVDIVTGNSASHTS